MSETKMHPLSRGDDNAPRFVYPPGRYKCRLRDIVSFEAKINERYRKEGDTRQTEPKYLFAFTVVDPNAPNPPDGMQGGLSRTARPVIGKRSDLYAMLSSMHPQGSLPEDLQRNLEKCFEHMMTHVGKYFIVTTRPSDDGQYNNVDTSIIPCSAPEGIAEPKSDFSSYTDGSLSENGRTSEVFRYQIESMAEDKKPLAESLLHKNSAVFDANQNLWISPTQIAKLIKYELPPEEISFDDDDMSF